MDQLDHLGWVVHRSYEVEGVQFGVRTNSEAAGAWLDATFGRYRVRDDTSPFLSILVAEDSDDQVKRFHILYEESRALVKSLDLGHVAAGLVAQFEHVAAPSRSDAVYLDAALVRKDGVVALVPPILPPFLATLGHRVLERSDLELPLANYVALDIDTGRVIPFEPSLDVPGDAIAQLQALGGSSNGKGPQPVAAPLEVDTICFLGLSEDPVTAIAPGQAAQILATRVLNLEELGGQALPAIGRLVDGARNYEIRSTSSKDTLATLLEALEP
jgi:hypothetical protein